MNPLTHMRPARFVFIIIGIIVLALVWTDPFTSYNNDDVKEYRYETVRKWVAKQPELREFVLAKLKDGKLTGHEIGQIATESIRLDENKRKPASKAYKAEFKKAMDAK